MLGLLPVHSKSMRGVIVKGRRKQTKKTTYWQTPEVAQNSTRLRQSSSWSSSLKPNTLTIVPQVPCLRRILPSYSLSGLAARGWGSAWVAVAKKTIFQALKNCCFTFSIWNDSEWTLLIAGVKPSTAEKQFFATWKIVFFALPLWDSEMRCCNSSFSVPGQTYQTSPALQKKHQALKDCFFGMPLAKPANSTSLPRLTSLEIAQIYIYTYIHSTQLRSKNLRDPRPIVVEMCLH